MPETTPELMHLRGPIPSQLLLVISPSVNAFGNDLPRFFASQTLISVQPRWPASITYRILSNMALNLQRHEVAPDDGT